MTISGYALGMMLYYAALVTSKAGYLGWGPPGMQKEDLVCVLYGCAMPVILRKVDDHHYIHIGSCWVLGLMNGEAIKRVEEGLESSVDFDIF